jgi:hypothetical protein
MVVDAVKQAFEEDLLETNILSIAYTAAAHGMANLTEKAAGRNMSEWNESGVLFYLNWLASYDGDTAELKALQPEAALALAEYQQYLQRRRNRS